MRLITLYKNLLESNNSIAQWENILEDDLDINPYSKLALVNCNFKFNDNIINVQPPNNQFTLFVTKADRGTIATVDPGLYNISSFIDAVQKAINNAINFDSDVQNPAALGLACSTFLDSNSLFNIQFKKETFKTLFVTESIGIDFTGGVLEREAVAIGPNNFTKFAEIGFNDSTTGLKRVPVCKGTFSTSIKLIDVGTTTRFIFGLINQQQDFTSGVDLTSERYTFSISNESGNGFYSINGTETDIECEINDIVNMELNNGKLSFTLLNTTKELPKNDISFKQFQGAFEENYIYISLFGNGASVSLREGTTAASAFTYQIDPFFTPTTIQEQLELINFRISIDFTQPTTFSDLGFILGFVNQILGQSGVSSLFTAVNKMDVEIQEDAGNIITIENIPLKSYNYGDSVAKKQSILYSLPAGIRDSIGVLSFNVDTLIPIDINNTYPLNARNLRFSVRNLKDNSLDLINEVALTIALLEKDE